MHFQEYNHNAADQHIAPSTLDRIRSILQKASWGPRDDTRKFRDCLLLDLAQHGWSNTVRIDNRSKISITSISGKTGLCLQTGNISRYYADILKLETLYRNDAILGGIYIIPLKEWAREIGSNIASFERMVEELQIFEATITIPIMVFGISEREQYARTRVALPKEKTAS